MKRDKKSKKIVFQPKKEQKTYFQHPFFSFWRLFTAFFVISLYFNITLLYAQDAPNADELNQWLQDILENQEETSDFDFNTIFEDLYFRLQSPLNINRATATELSDLQVLSPIEVNALLLHRSRYGDLQDIYELQAVEGLSIDKARILSRLCYVPGSGLILNRETDPITNLYLKWERDLQTRRGYDPEQASSPYLGDPNALYARLHRRAPLDWSYGLTLEKDAGERLSKGPDFISGHAMRENVSPVLDKIIFGDYSTRFGQGLILNNGFGIGKSSYTTSIKTDAPTLRPYTSAQENIYFRGIAAELRLSDRWQLISMLSSASHDANVLYDDSGRPLAVSSLQTIGLHRTINEIEDQNSLQVSNVGLRLTHQLPSPSDQISFNALYGHYSLPIQPSNTPYNQYRLSGDQSLNISLDHNVMIDGYNWFGELAISKNGALATTQSIITTLDPRLDLALNVRYFDRAYQAPLSNSFAESSRIQDEQGAYVGLIYTPHRSWRISGYADFWQYAWLRFRVDAPSAGHEYLLKIEHYKKRKSRSYLQYRYERKEENTSLETRIDMVVPRSLHRLRLHTEHHVGALTLRSRAELSHFTKDNSSENGLLIYQDVNYSSLEYPLSVTSRIAYFDVSDFDSRIYAFENDLLYEYSIPAYNGQGWRYYLNLRYRLSSPIMIEGRWSQTVYTDDRESIGSGNTEISGNKLTNVKLQLRYSF